MNIFKQKLEGFRHHQQIMTILVFTLVAVILWVAASLFSSQRRLGISPEQLKLSKPLTPVINTDVLLNLEQKQSFSNEELRKFPIYMLIKDQQQIEHIVEIGTKLEPLPSPNQNSKSLPSPSPAVTPDPSPAVTPDPSPVATPSAETNVPIE